MVVGCGPLQQTIPTASRELGVVWGCANKKSLYLQVSECHFSRELGVVWGCTNKKSLYLQVSLAALSPSWICHALGGLRRNLLPDHVRHNTRYPLDHEYNSRQRWSPCIVHGLPGRSWVYCCDSVGLIVPTLCVLYEVYTRDYITITLHHMT